MPRPVDEDRARRKALLEEKRAARRAAKEREDQERRKANSKDDSSTTAGQQAASSAHTEQHHHNSSSYLLGLSEDSIRVIFTCLSAADLGRLLLTCKSLNRMLANARVAILLSRLQQHRPLHPACCDSRTVGLIDIVSTEEQARALLEQLSYAGGGASTGRILPRTKYAKESHNYFVSYTRFLEEVVNGHCRLVRRDVHNSGQPIALPRFVQGRMASVSPEHSLCRIGGDGQYTGAGGSGVASWGVGRRGQLGHGQRRDERHPRRLLQLGYSMNNKLRIVQVAAGGGLVRVAHSLLLTSTGRVLSFGTGQYGALGHGYSAAKQLPDVLRPQYVTALDNVVCVCVAAGELHSAVVTADGDVYTWGDGFCGQLGHGDKRPQLDPKQVTMGGLEDEIVSSITCGSRHTVAVTEDGDVYTFGLGHFGVLGRSFTPFDYDADAAVADLGGDQELPLAAAAAVPTAAVVANNNADQSDLAADVLAHLDLIANLSLDDSSDQCYPQVVESLQGILVVGASAGHRHTLFLDNQGALYSCGAGNAGCLGHGDTESHMHPMRIASFDDEENAVRIRQMSAGVDMSMAVSTQGTVYAWGRTDGGRIGLCTTGRSEEVTLPRRVVVQDSKGKDVAGVDVECGYVHSLIVGVDGSLHMCGNVGVEGEADGQQEDGSKSATGPQPVQDFNIWHRLPEPKDEVAKKERWKKFGKYEVKGRSKMLNPD